MSNKASRRVAKSRAPSVLSKTDEEDPAEMVAEGEEEEADGEDEEEEGEEEEEEEKSELSTDDLRKSLSKLEKLAAATPASRKEALLSKALNDDLAGSEKSELFAMLGGGADPDSLPARVEKSMDPNENDTIAKSIDVSDFLAEMHTGVSKALGEVANSVEKSQNRMHEFNVVLAKGMLDMGRVIEAQNEVLKSMTERLGIYEQQPARGPKTKGLASPIEKSFAQAQEGGALSKSQVLDTLEQMITKSDAEGRGGTAACGEDLLNAVAKYESFNQISKALYGELVDFRRGGANGRAVH